MGPGARRHHLGSLGSLVSAAGVPRPPLADSGGAAELHGSRQRVALRQGGAGRQCDGRHLDPVREGPPSFCLPARRPRFRRCAAAVSARPPSRACLSRRKRPHGGKFLAPVAGRRAAGIGGPTLPDGPAGLDRRLPHRDLAVDLLSVLVRSAGARQRAGAAHEPLFDGTGDPMVCRSGLRASLRRAGGVAIPVSVSVSALFPHRARPAGRGDLDGRVASR